MVVGVSGGLEVRHTSTVIYAKLPDGSKAFLGYRVEGGIMKLVETYTPHSIEVRELLGSSWSTLLS